MSRGKMLLVMLSVLLMMTGAARSELLNLEVKYPLVTADFLTATYDNDAAAPYGKFHAEAYVDNWNPDGSGSIGLNDLGAFIIDIIIEPDNGEAQSGTLYVTGDLDNDLVSELLVKSSIIVAFGFGIDDMFEAIFEQEDGALGPVGAWIGVIIDARQIPQFKVGGNHIMPYFTINFASSGLKADLFVIPEPATMGLMLSGLALAALGRGRRRSRAKM